MNGRRWEAVWSAVFRCENNAWSQVTRTIKALAISGCGLTQQNPQVTKPRKLQGNFI